MPQAAPIAGWYADPVTPSQYRYWDGQRWTEHVRALGAAQLGATGVGGAPGIGQPGPNDPYGPGNPYGHQGTYGQPGAYGQQGAYGQPGAYGQQGAHGRAGAYLQPGYGQPTTEDGVPLAGWGMRLLAYLLDGLLLGILGMVAGLATAPLLQPYTDAATVWMRDTVRLATQGEPVDPATVLADVPVPIDILGIGPVIVLTLVPILIGLAYYTLFTRRFGQTPGKMACGLKVVATGRGQDTEPLSWRTCLVRAAIWLVPLLGSYIGALNFLGLFRYLDGLWPLFDRRRQSLHDKAAGTQVVRIR